MAEFFCMEAYGSPKRTIQLHTSASDSNHTPFLISFQ